MQLPSTATQPSAATQPPSAESDHLRGYPRLIVIISERRRCCTEVHQTSQNRPFPSQITENFRLRRAEPHKILTLPWIHERNLPCLESVLNRQLLIDERLH